MRLLSFLMRARVLLLPVLLMSRAARPAEKPTLAVEIDDEEVRYAVSLPIGLFDALVGIDRKDADFIDREERAQAKAAVEKLFRDKNPVRMDGILVYPVLREFEFIPAEPAEQPLLAVGTGEEDRPSWLPPEFVEAGRTTEEGNGSSPAAGGTPEGAGRADTWDPDRIRIAGGSVSIVLTYGTKGKPRQVSVVWRLFPDPGEAVLDEVRAGLVAYDDFREIRFTREEPEFVWHALEKPTRESLLALPTPAPPPTLSIPVVSAFLLIGLVCFLVLARRLKTSSRVRAAVSAITIIAALGTTGLVRAELPLAWKPGLERPDEADAKRIFETLHRNIYRAFDYKKEEDIYDALAQSVDGRLLDETYNEVYRSLILQDQGGAVCRVQSVKVLDMQVAKLAQAEVSDGIGFDVSCHWRVHGAVSHWGHTHFRTNEYRAVYSVEPREGAWKITAASVLEYGRVEDGSPSGGTSVPEKGLEASDGENP